MNGTSRIGAVDLYWLPVGAGSRVVGCSSRGYERLAARRQHRAPTDLYHTALEVHLDDDRYVIEMGPAWGQAETERGVVCEGPVGLKALGRLRAFRYEVRCWRDGRIDDVRWAVDSPVQVSDGFGQASDVLDLVRWVPWLTWGRDEIHAGEAWNSNSLVAWLLARTGHDLSRLHPPGGGLAPGWAAGVTLALRQRERSPFVPVHRDRNEE
jgi:hypothetical protein